MQPPNIITCPKWGARKPKAAPVIVGPATRFIMHHTDGHVPHLPRPKDDTRDEAIAYARGIQIFHMDIRGWNDSGHNFLVTRAGFILQGRWLTVTAIESGNMVVSAHCPGENEQIGIEFEHTRKEEMTDAQLKSGAALMAWVAIQYGDAHVLPMEPHNAHFATDCPANLVNEIHYLEVMATRELNAARKNSQPGGF